jgi:hypothetical protein
MILESSWEPDSILYQQPDKPVLPKPPDTISRLEIKLGVWNARAITSTRQYGDKPLVGTNLGKKGVGELHKAGPEARR